MIEQFDDDDFGDFITSYDNERRDEISLSVTSDYNNNNIDRNIERGELSHDPISAITSTTTTAGVGATEEDDDHMNNSSSSNSTTTVVFTSIPPLSNGKSSPPILSHYHFHCRILYARHADLRLFLLLDVLIERMIYSDNYMSVNIEPTEILYFVCIH